MHNRDGWNVWWKNIFNSPTRRKRTIFLWRLLWTGIALIRIASIHENINVLKTGIESQNQLHKLVLSNMYYCPSLKLWARFAYHRIISSIQKYYNSFIAVSWSWRNCPWTFEASSDSLWEEEGSRGTEEKVSGRPRVWAGDNWSALNMCESNVRIEKLYSCLYREV